VWWVRCRPTGSKQQALDGCTNSCCTIIQYTSRLNKQKQKSGIERSWELPFLSSGSSLSSREFPLLESESSIHENKSSREQERSSTELSLPMNESYSKLLLSATFAPKVLIPGQDMDRVYTALEACSGQVQYWHALLHYDIVRPPTLLIILSNNKMAIVNQLPSWRTVCQINLQPLIFSFQATIDISQYLNLLHENIDFLTNQAQKSVFMNDGYIPNCSFFK